MADFTQWCENSELSEETTKLLKDNGFSSVTAVKLLNGPLIQKHLAKTLTLGQLLLLQKAVDELQPAASSDEVASPSVVHPKALLEQQTVPTKDPGVPAAGSEASPAPIQDGRHHASTSHDLDEALKKGLDATSLLQLLGQPVGAPEDSAKGKIHTFDPFELDQTRLPSKLYEVRDYVTLLPEPTGKTSVMLGEVELTIPSAKPKMDSISPLQYMEASLRILREMAKDGQSTGALLQYVGYLIKVASMGQRFLWKSVIQYDTEYRKSQASLGFPFGADSTYMMQLYLRENAATNKPQASHVSKPNQHPQTKYDPTSGKPICGRFNTASGCALRGCKFAHICRTCFKSHSDASHHTQSATPSPNPPTAQKNSG